MNNFKRIATFASVAALSISLGASAAFATESINVTVLSGYPERTAWVRVFKEFWMPEVNKRLAETGNFELNYLEAFGTVVKPRGEFDGHMASIKTYAMLSKNPIEILNDFDGLQVSGAGPNLRWHEGLGSTGAPSALTKFYHDVDSGVTNAMIAWGDAVGAFKLCEAAPHFLSADMGAVTALAVVANKKWFDGLPEEVQIVIRETTPLYRDELARQSSEADASGRAAWLDQGGTIHELSAGQRQIGADTMPNIAKEWATEADADGLPGSEVLTAYMDKMRAADQKIARHWDQE